MAGPSPTSSMSSSRAFSVSGKTSNGNGGVISSVLWLVTATALCLPWLLERPAVSKEANTERSFAWFAMLGLDLILGTMGVFSLWFRNSALSIMLLIWGSCAIMATFLLGSFAMLPAVATMCCCAPDLCLAGAADISSLDDNFCYVPFDLCLDNRWRLWCFYGGILLTMVSTVLLVNSFGLHHKTLRACEREAREAAMAARAAYRARRRQQELWEREVYGYGAPSARTRRSSLSPVSILDEDAATPVRRGGSRSSGTGRGRDPFVVAPSHCSPSLTPPRSPDANKIARVKAGTTTTTTTTVVTPSAPAFSPSHDGRVQVCRSPTPALLPSVGRGRGDDSSGVFAFGAATARRIRREGMEEEEEEEEEEKEGRRVEAWGSGRGGKGCAADVVMSWVCDDEEEGGGRITPKTALRFKTSALAKAIRK